MAIVGELLEDDGTAAAVATEGNVQETETQFEPPRNLDSMVERSGAIIS